MTRVYYKEAHGCIIMFDLTNKHSFDNCLKWKKDVDSKCCTPGGRPIPCILLANKVIKYSIRNYRIYQIRSISRNLLAFEIENCSFTLFGKKICFSFVSVTSGIERLTRLISRDSTRSRSSLAGPRLQ